MSMVIWKFHLDVTDRCTVRMPSIRTYLSVGQQDGQLVLWAAVDPTAPVEERQFLVVGTGHQIPAEATYYRGTVPMPNGLVWHIWEAA